MKWVAGLRITAPSDEQAAHTKFWWVFSDKVFKLVEWSSITALIQYEAGRVHSRLLSVLYIFLFFCIFKTITSSYEQYTRVYVADWVKRSLTIKVINLVFITFIGFPALLVSQWFLTRVIAAIMQSQSLH